MQTMPVPKRCSGCGAEIPPAAPGGLCASCLLTLGLGTEAVPEALEAGDGLACHDLLAQLSGLDADGLNVCMTQALAWAGNIGRETPEH